MVVAGWIEDAHNRRADRHAAPEFFKPGGFDRAGLDQGRKRPSAGGFNPIMVPDENTRIKVAQHVHQPVHVITAGMGQDQIIDGQDLLAAQKRRNHVAPHVEGAIVGIPSAVHQHGMPPRKLDQGGIALPHIQKRQTQIAVRQTRLVPPAGIQRQECNGDREQPFGRWIGANGDKRQKQGIIPADFPDSGLKGTQRDELKGRRPAGGRQKNIQQNAARLQTP